MSENVLINAEDILVRAQDTPNPRAIKFIVNYALKEVGNATFTDVNQCEDLVLAKSIFDIPGIEQLYFFQNTLTVTHMEELPTDIMKNQVMAVIKSRLAVHNPNFESPDEKKQNTPPDRSNMSESLRQVEEILDRTIRPGLQSDGGDVEVLSFEGNKIDILYQGACGGCPSAMMGTLDAIQSILRHELGNEDLIVTPV